MQVKTCMCVLASVPLNVFYFILIKLLITKILITELSPVNQSYWQMTKLPFLQKFLTCFLKFVHQE